MKRRLLAVAAVLGALTLAHASGAPAASEPPAVEQIVPCAECGMKTKVANRFTARIDQGGAAVYFCDIGDMAAYIRRTNPKQYAASVHDFRTGEWIDAAKAFFVIDKKIFATPMGWGVAAFRDRAEASGTPLDFEALRKALR